MEIYKFFKGKDRIDSSKIEEELQNVVNQNKKELEKAISLQRKDVLRILKTYFKDIVLGKDQFELNQGDFTTFIKNLQKDTNPSELLEMIKEDSGISVQKMQFLNRHYQDGWMRENNRKSLFVDKFENKIPLSLRAVRKKVYPSDFELQKDFPATGKVLEKYFLDTPVDDEIQNMIKTKKMLPHYRYLLECYDVSLKGCVDLEEFLKFCYGVVRYVKVKNKKNETWFLNHYSDEGNHITLYDFLYYKNGAYHAGDILQYDSLARSYEREYL